MSKNWVSRYGWFVAGVLLNSFGVALITKAALGTSPISSLPYVLSFRFPVTLGQFTFVMNMFFILGQWLLLRKDFHPIQFLQIAVNVLFSLVIDVSMGLLSWLEPDTLPAQLLALAAGCAGLIYHLASLETFGVPYLAPFTAGAGQPQGHPNLLRPPLPRMKWRDGARHTENRRNQR